MNKQDVYLDRKTGQFANMTSAHLQKLAKQFPDVNLNEELDKMVHWLMTSPKGVTYQGNLQFIRNWLVRCTSTVRQNVEALTQQEAYIPNAMEGYLDELWKGKQELLKRNTKTS